MTVPLGGAYAPAPVLIELGDAILRRRRAGALPAAPPALPQPALGRARRPRRRSTPSSGSATSRASRRCPTTCRSRWRCATTAISSASTTPSSATAAASCSRSCATRRRPPARSRHQGQRPNAVVARRRRPADAEGRRARGARHRDAGGARRLHVEGFSLFETGESLYRGDEPSPTRSSVLVRLEPLAHPHRHLSALRVPRRRARCCAACSTTACGTTCPKPRRRRRRAGGLRRRRRPALRARCAPRGWSPASSTACSTATT